MTTIKVKAGVQPRLINILAGVANVAATLATPSEVWITSGIDGVHSMDSLHYALRAVDIRSRNFPSAEALQSFVARLRTELGPAYQVIVESDHIHVEFDPR